VKEKGRKRKRNGRKWKVMSGKREREGREMKVKQERDVDDIFQALRRIVVSVQGCFPSTHVIASHDLARIELLV